jgi:hypothetical protein
MLPGLKKDVINGAVPCKERCAYNRRIILEVKLQTPAESERLADDIIIYTPILHHLSRSKRGISISGLGII